MNYSLNVTNGTENGLLIPNCWGDIKRVPWANYCLAALSFLAVTINIVHVFILSRMNSLRGTPYFFILVHISAADMVHGFGTGMRLVFSDASYFINTPIAGFIVFTNCTDLILYGRNALMAAASLERYYAMCRPMDYPRTRFITKLNLWLILIWVLSFVYNIIRDSLFSQAYCFHFALGPFADSVATGFINMLVTLMLFVFTSITLMRVSLELYRMGKRMPSQEDQQVKKATQFLLIIIGIFYLCFIPPTVEYGFQVAGQFSITRFYINQVLILAFYGILNNIIYGWVTPAYRKRLVTIITCKSNAVTNNASVTNETNVTR